MRFFLGADSRMLIPASALGGGALLCIADLISRSLLPPMELPAGRGDSHHRRALFPVPAQEEKCPHHLSRASWNWTTCHSAYDRSQPLITDLSFTVGQGEFIGLLGANGSGKSTILKLGAGMLKPCSGSVRLWGKDIQALQEQGPGQADQLSAADAGYHRPVHDQGTGGHGALSLRHTAGNERGRSAGPWSVSRPRRTRT